MAGRIVVTGGFGYIGRHVVHRLSRAKARVAVLARRANGFAADAAVETLVADVRDRDAVERTLRGGDVIVHLACLAVGPSRSNPADDFAVNALGTFHVLEAARRQGAARVVVVSSAEVYGPPSRSPMAEDHPLSPSSPYGASKASGDLIAGVYRSLYGLDTVVLRLFNVFGPAVDGSPRPTVETLFVTNARAGLPLTIQAHPDTTRDFVFVGDVANVITMCADGAGSAPVYNIGSGEATSLAALALAAGYPASAIPSTFPKLETPPVRADITLARRDLQFAPTKNVVDYVREVRDAN